MTKLQASMKESSTRRQALSLAGIAYKVGSYFHGCDNCGEVEWVPWGNRMVKRYKSGYDVHRAYSPSATKWTYYCMTCSAKDLRCWNDAEDIGEEAIRGTRDAIARSKALRKARLKFEAKANVEVRLPEKDAEIEKLEAEVKRLEALLNSAK